MSDYFSDFATRRKCAEIPIDSPGNKSGDYGYEPEDGFELIDPPFALSALSLQVVISEHASCPTAAGDTVVFCTIVAKSQKA